MPDILLSPAFCDGLRRPLPDTLNPDGRPVWEPPSFNYADLIGDEFEAKRQAALKYTHGDPVKATEILDKETELRLFDIYLDYLRMTLNGPAGMYKTWDASKLSYQERFYICLHKEVAQDYLEASAEYGKLNVRIRKLRDGTYAARPPPPPLPSHSQLSQTPSVPFETTRLPPASQTTEPPPFIPLALQLLTLPSRRPTPSHSNVSDATLVDDGEID